MDKKFEKSSKLPREVWVSAISLKDLWPARTTEQRIKDVLERIESLYPFEPDIIVLPETIQTSWVTESKGLDEMAEDEHSAGPVTRIFADIARQNHCYITCPIITKKDGRYYNSSILLNREGRIDGVFHKIRPTSKEIIGGFGNEGTGITPGALRPPVFKTDFGTVGMQIGTDASWRENWGSLKQDGAEIVLFSSQDSYANILGDRAWFNHYYIVSATGLDSRILDVTGDVIESDGEFARWVCAPINLEKEFLHIWPQTLKFKDIQRKYQRKVRIHIYHPENWATIESLDPDIKVKDILMEYGLPNYDEQLREATKIQHEHRL
jgi:predicted amidohydrolase